MVELRIIDRSTNKIEIEKVLGKNAIIFLYSNNFFSKIFLFLFAKIPLFSFIYGKIQATKISRRKILPFIKKFNIDSSEFVKNVEDFQSFNDFFIRKLKKEKRPIETDEKIAILPADARYFVFENISLTDNFFIKGEKFDLRNFLQDDFLAKKYENGSMVIARLCPSDYHRFHFCVSGTALKPKLINGFLFSVNSIVLKKNMKIFYQNKRMLTLVKSKNFKDVLYVEIGATNVGSIIETFNIDSLHEKGDEKGYFGLGASSVVLLFEKNTIKFSEDLILNSQKKLETKALFGEPLGKSLLV